MPYRDKRSRPRPKTLTTRRMERDAKISGTYPPGEADRPRTRGDCPTQRPCPFVSCRHHLYLDVNAETGSIRLNFPDLEPWELERSCSLDEADRGRKSLDEVGSLTNLTRERARQIEEGGLVKLRRPAARALGRSPVVEKVSKSSAALG